MKKIVLITWMSLITVLMAGLVYGVTCTFDQLTTTAGTSSTYIRGISQNLSVTITGNVGVGQNVTKCMLNATGTISGALIYNTTAIGDNLSYCNTTVSTTALLDNTTYTFMMTMLNYTNQTLGQCTRNFISDNTVPAINSSHMTPSDMEIYTNGENIGFGLNVSNSSSATLYIEENAYTMTASSSLSGMYNHTLNLHNNGFYSWYVTASDGLNTTTTTTLQVELRKPGGMIIDEQEDAQVSTVAIEGKGITKIMNEIMNFIFGIIDSIFSAIRG